MKKIVALLAALSLALGLLGGAFSEEAAYEQPELNPRVKSIIEADGYQFIDLNANGALDVYEDWRLDAETRADDLVAQMTLREKIAQMQHPTFLPRADGKFPSYLKKWCEVQGIGMLLIRELDSVEAAAVSMNTIQEYAESSRLGVPVLVSMDSVHGLSYVSGATVTGHNLALAATRDEDLVIRLAEMAREEHIAIGVRMTFSPESDIASEPRWGRVMETFGEAPELVTEISIMIVMVWQFSGYVAVIFLAAIKNVSTSIINAAKLDGAYMPRIYWKMVIPQLKGAMGSCITILAMYALRSFDLIYTMTGLTNTMTATLPIMMYNQMYAHDNYAYAAAISCFLLALVLVLILPLTYLTNRRK